MRLFASAAIGAIIGVGIGYEILKLTRSNAPGLIEWLSSSGLNAVDWIIWAIIGAAAAAELTSVRSRP